MPPTTQHATFASGCFWCSEPLFQDLRGVITVTPGYAGGRTANPTYEQVSTGRTGHAESLDVEFDPSVISYDQLLEVFFYTHDPTQLNRQGHDVGEEYRSVIFPRDAEQQVTAEAVKAQIAAERIYPGSIVTAIEPFTSFYPAEEYHHNYFAKNPDAMYCQVVINPKVAKFRQRFSAWRK